MVSYKAAKRSFLGTREEQQDYALFKSTDSSIFAVVCDGMGGLKGGSIASSVVATELMTQYENKEKSEPIKDFFFNTVDVLDEKVCNLVDEDNKKMHAGTTLVAVCIEGNRLNWLSVGDSRLYVIRGREIVQATRDHNYNLNLNALLKSGALSEQEYKKEKVRGESLISFIGIGGIEVMDISQKPLPLQNGDYVLLTTDGLFKLMSDQEIKEIIITGRSVDESADFLIEKSFKKAVKFQDNTTFVLIKIEEKEK